MNRLTTDNPQNNFETMMNLVYAKDEWHHIRHGDTDMETTDFCLELCKARGCEHFEKCETDEEKDECLCSCLFDGCPIATVYAALCGYGHTRSRLKMYEDMGMEPKWISVKDREPEKCGYYLVACEGEDIPHVLYFRGKTWAVSQSHYHVPEYWIEIPKPPKEG